MGTPPHRTIPGCSSVVGVVHVLSLFLLYDTLSPMTVLSVGIVDLVQYIYVTLDAEKKTRRSRLFLV